DAQDVQPLGDVVRVDVAVVVVRRPGTAGDEAVGGQRSPLEPGDLLGLRGVGEVPDRDAALVPGLDHQVAAPDGDQRAVVGDAVLGGGRVTGDRGVAAEGQVGVGAPALECLVAVGGP